MERGFLGIYEFFARWDIWRGRREEGGHLPEQGHEFDTGRRETGLVGYVV